MVLFHGLTGTPDEVKPLGMYLARRGVRVLIPWLPGHGETPQALAKTGKGDWTATAEASFDRLRKSCVRVFAGGLSMGGLLALHLGFTRRPAGVLSMSAPIHIRDFRFRGLGLFRFLQWHTRELTGGVLDPKSSPHVTYATCPTSSLYEMKKLADALVCKLPELKVPLLVLHGAKDRMVSIDNALFLHNRSGSRLKHLVVLDRSDHVLTLDYDRREVFRRTGLFIRSRGFQG